MTTLSRTTTIEETVELVERDGAVSVTCYTKTMSSGEKTKRKTEKFFLSKAELKKKLTVPYLLSRDRRRYIYLSPEQMSQIEDDIWGEGMSRLLNKVLPTQVPNRLIEKEDFDVSRLFYFDHNTHMVYGIRSDLPISVPILVDEIGGLNNANFDLRKAMEVLRANPGVRNLRIEEIPYYNREEGKTHGLHFEIKLSQKMHDRIVRYYRDKTKAEYWTCRVHDSCRTSYDDGFHRFDPLGLKAAMIPEEEKKKDDYHDL